jgi:hypothetical protein
VGFEESVMGIIGLKVAKLFGRKLPAFNSKSQAENVLFSFRDIRLERIQEFAARSLTISADYSPESIKVLEKWYFDLFENGNFKSLGTNREEFEECMAMYFGEVMVRNIPESAWVVEEFVFTKDRYEIGVRTGNLTIMLSRFTDHFNTPNNKRRQSLWRKYKQYWS